MLGFSRSLQYLGTNIDEIADKYETLLAFRANFELPRYRFEKTANELKRKANGVSIVEFKGKLNDATYSAKVDLSWLAGESALTFLMYYAGELRTTCAQYSLSIDRFIDQLNVVVPMWVNHRKSKTWSALPFVLLTGDTNQLQRTASDRTMLAAVDVPPQISDITLANYLKENLHLMNVEVLQDLARRVIQDGNQDVSLGSLLLFLSFSINAGEQPAIAVPDLEILNEQIRALLGLLGLNEYEYELLKNLVPQFVDTLFDFPIEVPEIRPVKIGGEFVFLGDKPVIFQDLAGYSLVVRFEPSNGTASEATYRWPKLTPDSIPNRKVHFEFDALKHFAIDSNIPGTVLVEVTTFDGSLLYQQSFAPTDSKLARLRIEVPLRKPVPLGDATPATPGVLRGKVIELSGKCPLKDLIVVLEARRDGDDTETWRVVGTGTTDIVGSFNFPYPKGVFIQARALVSTQPDKPISVKVLGDPSSIAAETTIPKDVLYLLIDAWKCETKKEGDCNCHDGDGTTPRLPTQSDLMQSDKFSQDLGNGCVSLTTPNRTLHESTYYAIVRTSDPDVAQFTLQKTEKIDEIDGFRNSVFTLGDGEKITRRPVAFDNPIRWQDAPDNRDKDNHLSFYQSVEVATGHLLHYRSVLKADGYSLGDLLYSLPLAPGQKKQIVTYDWKRSLVGSESQQLVQREGLNAGITSDRTIVDGLTAGINESLRGSSEASTGGISAGLGVGAMIGPVSAILGVAGGYSHASSSASQNAARITSQTFNEALRQAVMQSSSAFRELNGTLIDTVKEGQQFAATTEVVANHNHCHSLTMMYFEVLRHFAVFQELVEVEECLFVPLVMTNFTRENVHKWRDVLASRLLQRQSSTYLLSTFGANPLRKAFDSNERVLTNWANVDFPNGRYCDETITDIRGSMTFRVSMPRPKTKYDRIFSFPIITKTVSHEEFDLKTAAKSAFLGSLTGGLSFLVGEDKTTRTVSEQILVRSRIFDQFMQLDDNFQTARPADCIRVRDFMPQPATDGLPFNVSGPDFFENTGNDKAQWEAYAQVLGYSGPTAVYQMLNGYFKDALISEWDRIFKENIVPLVWEKFINGLTIDLMNLDFTAPKYQGGERLLTVQVRGNTNIARINFPDRIVIKCGSASVKLLKGFITLNIERMQLGYSTPHFNGYLFQGTIRDDILDDTSLAIPISNEEKRDPRKEDKYLANELISHLNANLEYYNKALWYNLDIDRRYLLLDGFNIQTYDDLDQPSVVRSLASVVKNKLIGIAGNALIFPVAAGVKIDLSYIIVGRENNETKVSLFEHYRPLTPPEPYRISLPTRGVYAEAVQGVCDACENLKDNSSQDWEKFRTDEPTPIAPLIVPTPTPTDWRAAFKDFATPIVNIQNSPSQPAPGAGLANVGALLGDSNVFRDVTGLAGNQSNAMTTFLSNQENAKAFAQMAKEMATQTHNTQNADKIKTAINEGQQSGNLSKQDAGTLTKEHIQQMIDGGEAKRSTGEVGKPSLTQAGVEAAAQGKAVKATNTDVARGTTETLEINDSLSALRSDADLQLAFNAGEFGQYLQQTELKRRMALKPEDIAKFTPTSEATLVSYATEWRAPTDLTVVNWQRSGLDHYGSILSGRRIGGRIEDTPSRTPISYPIRQLPRSIILHETAGWAQVGAGTINLTKDSETFDYGLSVHFSVGPDGTVYQHNDIAQTLEHAGKANRLSIGIEVTNGSVFNKTIPGPFSLTPSGKKSPLTSIQTGATVGGVVTEDRERIAISWVDGTPNTFVYILPPMTQLEGVTQLLAWLCSGTSKTAAATFLNVQETSHWGQYLVRSSGSGNTTTITHSFLLHGNPVWRDPGFDDFDGIYAHANFDADRADGGAIALYCWLRLFCNMSPNSAYAAFRKLITDPSFVHQTEVAPGRKAWTVNVSDYIPKGTTI